jgi:threonine/homoserine/homoserine lactone efflux protein
MLGCSYLVAVMSPGPSFAIIAQNSLRYSSKIGFFTALGTISGIALQAFYALASLSFLQTNPLFLRGLSLILGSYITCLGIRFFFQGEKEGNLKFTGNKVKSSSFLAFKQGFLIDALNPLALTFFLAVFSSYVDYNHPLFIKFLCWVEIVLIGFFWFTAISLALSNMKLRRLLLNQLKKPMEVILSFVFLFLGIRMILQSIY